MSTILIIEDDARLRPLLARQLEGRGWRVTAVGTVADGRAALAAGAYDVMLLDLGLPDGAGWEVASAAPGVPVIVMTCREVLPEERLTYRPAKVLYKPLGLVELFAQLDRYAAPVAGSA